MQEMETKDLFELPGFSRYLVDIYTGRIYRKPTDKRTGAWLKKHRSNKIGYCYTTLINDLNEPERMGIHWCVICAATESTKDFFTSKNLQVDHKDRNKSNNNIHNLKLCTAKQNHENIYDRKKPVRLKQEDKEEIFKDFAEWEGKKTDFYQLKADKIGCVWQSIQYLILREGTT